MILYVILTKLIPDQILHEDVDINAVTGGDPDVEHKLKVIVLEAEVMRQEGRNTPSSAFMKTFHWQEIIKMETRTARKKYLEFLFKIEKKKENDSVSYIVMVKNN